MRLRQTQGPRSGRSRPQLESLEDRWCPSVTVQGHIFTVTGSAGNDQITVRDGGHGNVTATVVDAQGHKSSLSASSVQKIVINALGGDDHINYALASTLTTAEQIVVNAGSGDNQISFDFSKGVSAPSLNVQVQGGQGGDTVSALFGTIHDTNLSFNTDLGNGFGHASVVLAGDVTGHAKVAVALTAGAGFDGLSVKEKGNIGAAAQVSLMAHGGAQSSTVHVDYTGKLDGKLTVQARGGASADWLESAINLTPGSTGWLTAHENGGPGDDLLVLTVHDKGSHLKLRDALADGGTGTSYSIHTSNVHTQHIST
jgi:hypothetical protein